MYPILLMWLPPLLQYLREVGESIPDDPRVKLKCTWPSYASTEVFYDSAHKRLVKHVGEQAPGLTRQAIGYTYWSYEYSCDAVLEESVVVYGPCGILLNEEKRDVYKNEAVSLWLHEFKHVSIATDFLDELESLVETAPCNELKAKVRDANIKANRRSIELDTNDEYR